MSYIWTVDFVRLCCKPSEIKGTYSDKLLAGGDVLVCHLNCNDMLHEYKETEEEVLITILREVKSIYNESPVKTDRSIALKALNDIRVVQDKNLRLQKVLHNDELCMLLAMCFLQLGPHF
ncbi:hypothetical protein EV702DRAFT_1051097 [Suillus placidus]|uniref:Uncharacterized protein n=1 Tax=Suillus placidus TaxID=48579 RepID=A0A9P6ZGH5_9AGAM|nr:hypothetical protein EV702DRAFT_1051097 [Suillus placidus]